MARWDFGHGRDDVLHDRCGNGNHGKIVGATWVKAGKGHTLWFNGLSDRVDCGSGAALDLRNHVTVEAWVMPEELAHGEPNIAGKGPLAYGLTYYRDGRCYWYISDGSNSVNIGLGLGMWHHVVGTYDGKRMALYANGALVDSKPLSIPIKRGGAFLIGASDRGYFSGGISGVRVYNRALRPDEVAAHLKEADMGEIGRPEPASDAQVLKGQGYSVGVTTQGAVRVHVGDETYTIDTQLSEPGDSISWNVLGVRGRSSKKQAWQPSLESLKEGGLRVSAAGSCYSLERTVRLAGRRAVVADKITNTGEQDVGILYCHVLGTAKAFSQRRIAGADQAGANMTSENPSAFVGLAESRLGWIAEDDIGRLQLALAATVNRVRMSVNHFALQPGNSHTFRWAVYPFGKEADYWAFVNLVRRDWDVNFTMRGPWTWIDLSSKMDLFRDEAKLKAYFERNRAQVAAFGPWVDYDNYNAMTGKPATRAETRAMMQEAMRAIKKVNPDITCVGCIECNLVSLPAPVAEAIYATVKGQPQGQYAFTDEHMAILRKHDIRWKDCLLQRPDGKYRYELYYRGPERKYPMMAIAVFPAEANDQHKYWLDQAKFLLEEVGLDGLYIDQFNLAFSAGQRYSYHAWDGVTVDIDKRTGRITRRYTDGGYVSIGARTDLARYVLSKGTYMIANTFPSVPQMQAVPMHRFNESEWSFDPMTWKEGEKPPWRPYPCKGHLSTPIALGFRPQRVAGGEQDYARVIMKMAIAYLRHGLLYYHYGTEIPEEGPGAGEYGAINHMFPMTPVELHEGWIVGEERTITAVSGTYKWSNPRRPKVLVFDIKGHAADKVNADVKRGGGGWTVQLKLKDWAEIAVIE